MEEGLNNLKNLKDMKNLKNLSKAALMVLTAFAMTSCISDDLEPCPDNNGGLVESNPAYYIQVNIQVPDDLSTRTRDGEDEGGDTGSGDNSGSGETTPPLEADNEKVVEAVDLYFLYAENTTDGTTTNMTKDKVILKLSSKTSDQSSIKKSTKDNADYTAKIYCGEDEFEGLKELAGKEVNLLVVCNPDKMGTITYGDNEKAYNATFTVAAGGIFSDFGTDNKGLVLPMANAKVYPIHDFKDISSTEPEEIIQTIKGLFHPVGSEMIKDLTVLDVERAVARFDIGFDNSDIDPAGSHPSAWVYHIEDPELNLRMYSVTPVNINNRSFVARHISAGATTGVTQNGYDFLEKAAGETGQIGWKVDPTWSYENEDGWIKHTNGAFLNPVSIKEGSEVGALQIGGNANMKLIEGEGGLSTRNQIKGYYPWCYVSENMFLDPSRFQDPYKPASEATGVAFTFRVLDTKLGEPLYWDKTQKKLIILNTAEGAAKPSEMTVDEETGVATIKKSDGSYITVEPDETDGTYNLTYFGFIYNYEVNDPYVANTLGYGVVRNTVYQLRVNKITDLPFPEKPKTLYLDLDVKVLAWCKREIEVEF